MARYLSSGCLVVLAVLLSAATLSAADSYWNTTYTAAWTVGPWAGGVPGLADNAHIGAPGYALDTDTTISRFTTCANLYLAESPSARSNLSINSGSSGSLTVSGSMVVGEMGYGLYTQSAGSTGVREELIVDRSGSADASRFTLAAGTLSAGTNNADLVVGDEVLGKFNQTGGSVSVGGDLVLGRTEDGNGDYRLQNAATVSGDNLIIGDAGTGSFYQYGSSSADFVYTSSGTGYVYLGYQADSSGLYTMYGGELNVTEFYVGQEGDGTLRMNGGTVYTVNNVRVGRAYSSGTGTGLIEMLDSDAELNTQYLRVGDYSDGEVDHQAGDVIASRSVYVGSRDYGKYTLSGGNLTIQDSLRLGTSTGGVGEFYLQGGTLTLGGASNPMINVRSYSSSHGLFEGYGTPVFNDAALQNSDRVWAKGYGVERDLDLSDATAVYNTRDNYPNGIAGWRATEGGRLLLPSVQVATGNPTVYWGEDMVYDSDGEIDLVNSIQLSFSSVTDSDYLDIALQATGRSDVPEGLINPVAVWSMEPVNDSFEFDSVDLMVIYDRLITGQLGVLEEDLLLLQYIGAGWVDVTSSLDTDANLIGATDCTSVTFFAVATGHEVIPEPATLALLVAGLLALAATFRRRRSPGLFITRAAAYSGTIWRRFLSGAARAARFSHGNTGRLAPCRYKVRGIGLAPSG